MSVITDLASRAGSAAQSLWEASGQLVQPSLRLGVTGLARSGKTVFTTALVHHLIEAGALAGRSPVHGSPINRPLSQQRRVLSVRPDLADEAPALLSGWLGHRAPFAFASPSALCVPNAPTYSVWIGSSR